MIAKNIDFEFVELQQLRNSLKSYMGYLKTEIEECEKSNSYPGLIKANKESLNESSNALKKIESALSDRRAMK